MIRMQLRWKPVMVKQDFICYDFVHGFIHWQVILCSSADNFSCTIIRDHSQHNLQFGVGLLCYVTSQEHTYWIFFVFQWMLSLHPSCSRL